jgi:hypothetical protein
MNIVERYQARSTARIALGETTAAASTKTLS